MAVMKHSIDHSQFPQTATWTHWLYDAMWPSLDVWAISFDTLIVWLLSIFIFFWYCTKPHSWVLLWFCILLCEYLNFFDRIKYLDRYYSIWSETNPSICNFLITGDALVHSAVLRLHVVRPSVTLVDQDHIGWKSWKQIARSIRPTPLLFVAQRSST